MRSISDQKALRRKRLAKLRLEVGEALLAERSGLSPAFIWQMAEAADKKKRSVNDENARKLEIAGGKAPGWLDQTDDEPIGAYEDLPRYDTKGQPVYAKDLSPEASELVRLIEEAEGSGAVVAEGWTPVLVFTKQIIGSAYPKLTDEQKVIAELMEQAAADNNTAAMAFLQRRLEAVAQSRTASKPGKARKHAPG